MTSIQLVERRPTSYMSADGSGWPSAAEAQGYNAELIAYKLIGRLAEAQGYNRSTIRNLANFAPLTDLKVLRAMLNHYVAVLRVPIMEIKQKVGHLPGGRIRTIKTEDGREHYSKDDALRHILEAQFDRALKLGSLSSKMRIVFTRGMVFKHTTNIPTEYEIKSTFNDLFKVRYADGSKKDMAPIMIKVLDAIIEARSAPVESRTPK